MICDARFVGAVYAEAEYRVADLLHQMRRLIADGGARVRLSLRNEVEACRRAVALLAAVTVSSHDACDVFLSGLSGDGVDESAFAEDDDDVERFIAWANWLIDVEIATTPVELHALVSQVPNLWGATAPGEPTGPSVWERLADEDTADM